MAASSLEQVSIDHLRVYLSHTWLPTPTIKITVQNAHPCTPLSFLTWDTPVDPSALNTGVLQLVDAVSGENIEGPGLKLNRLLPPPRDALVEIGPQDVVEVDVELSAPWIPGNGKLVKVHAHGEWKAVWAKTKDAVSDEELNAMSGADVMQGPFRSIRDVELEVTK